MIVRMTFMIPKPQVSNALLIITCLLFATGAFGAAEFQVVTCGETASDGMRVTLGAADVLAAYSQSFELSDGSRMALHDVNSTAGVDTVKYVRTLMGNIGVNSSFAGQDRWTFELCGPRVTQLFLLAVLGNFVSNPSDPALTTQTSSETLATVVIDTYTNKLTLVNSFNIIRSAFLETLLIISIIAIGRLALVRNVTITERNPCYLQPQSKDQSGDLGNEKT